jgi:hypothetical protein
MDENEVKGINEDEVKSIDEDKDEDEVKVIDGDEDERLCLYLPIISDLVGKLESFRDGDENGGRSFNFFIFNYYSIIIYIL